MSRVEEALRRARTAQNSGLEGRNLRPTEQARIAAAQLDVFTPDAFPPESLRPEVPVPPRVQTVTQPTAPRADAATQGGSLLEHLERPSSDKVVIGHGIMPACREQYRRLAATLHHLQTERDIKIVMVASAVAGEGKTLTATNLSLTFSESYRRRVLLIDADLRSPSVHRVFEVPNATGLREGLEAASDQKIVTQQFSARLSLLTAGRAHSDPMAGLTSDRMRRVLIEARQSFDWVIIDTPPVALLPDTNLLAAMVDAAVLVVKASETPYQLVQHAVDAVSRNRIVGVVLNCADEEDFRRHYRSYDTYYSAYHQSEPQSP